MFFYIIIRKVLLSQFHLNGQTLGFYPLTQKLEPRCASIEQYQRMF